MRALAIRRSIWTKGVLMRTRLLLAGLTVVVAAVLAAGTAPGSRNTFPGRNGLIAYAAGGYGSDFDLCVMAADGSRQRRLLRGPTADLEPAWTADGAKLAFSRRASSYGAFETNTTLYMLSGPTLRVTRALGLYGERWGWSPDSSLLVFDYYPRHMNADVFVVAADGGGAHRIARSASSPDWSPDGSRIALRRIFPPPVGIYVVAPDGTDPRLLVPTDFGRDPSWSPDGRKIAFGDERGIWIVNSDGKGQLSQLTHDDDSEPAWSPDGTKIAFVRATGKAPGDNRDIWVVSVDGTGEQPLTRTPFPEFGPSWRAAEGRKRVGLNQGCSPSTVGTAGRDVLRGGRRDDAIYGLAGNDRIYGKGGHDWLSGGWGDDVLSARDGAFDEIFCGPGRDRAVADLRDRVGRDCERVIRR
jgi:Tol biopolymer transport system component